MDVTEGDIEFGSIQALAMPERIARLRRRMLDQERALSLEQARLVTESYRRTEGLPRILRRAEALAQCMRELPIRIADDELIVGNRTPASRAGVVFPEASVTWLDREIETLPTRPQDRFEVTPEQIGQFRREILPYWRGRTLEDAVYAAFDDEILAAGSVVKINQRDHAQGHIIPNVGTWLAEGPAGLLRQVESRRSEAGDSDFLRAVATALEGARDFIRRYADLAAEASAGADDLDQRRRLDDIAGACRALADGPARTFRQALQSVWFLMVLLHMESNASSFSPGRLDQTLLPYLRADLAAGRIDLAGALELIECLWLKFNQIVYMRNGHSARYFAGFPIGFNVCIGGQDARGRDATNELSHLFLKAQEHVHLPQPNLSARIHRATPERFLEHCVRVIGRGSGMPQVFNDESVIPALERVGILADHARDYGVVGCVELSSQGNCLGWSDAAMFNLVKALELALNDGVCLVTGERLGPPTGGLPDFGTFGQLEAAYEAQIDHFLGVMFRACELVERAHADMLPSPLLSSVVDGCLTGGIDVTAGGAKYNLSGIQAVQAANVADCLAAVKRCVFEQRKIAPAELMAALRSNFNGKEDLRQHLLQRVPKYGNDVAWVDELGARWVGKFAEKLSRRRNCRGGPYHMGLYTVSAHVPMGVNVGATPDGRLSGTPLADGGVSPMYGRDRRGPTAVLRSVSRLPFNLASNGALLNMKFLPSIFETDEGVCKFTALLRGFSRLGIHHVQFNVLWPEDLRRAQQDPEAYRHLTVRVAGYTAYFTELAKDIQDEIIARTTFTV